MTEDLPSDSEALRRRVRDAEAQLARLELTLDVVGTTDLDAGILNRNGVLESLERGRRWMARRGDLYGVLVVEFPGLESIDVETALDTVRHLSATIAAGLREVDEVGRISPHAFAATLADVRPGATQIVADRVHQLVSKTIDSIPGVERCGVAAIEVLSVDATPSQVLERCTELATTAGEQPVVSQL